MLITGENGTGKEVVARNIHAKSKRLMFLAVSALQSQRTYKRNYSDMPRGIYNNFLKRGKFELANPGTSLMKLVICPLKLKLKF